MKIPRAGSSSGSSAEMSTSPIVIVSGESNMKTPPKFTGSGFAVHEDPLQFVEDFTEAATWNNWQEARLNELFCRCLQGFAKDWYIAEIRESPTFQAGTLPFSSPTKNKESLISKFKTKRQGANESAAQFIIHKRALYLKANAKGAMDKQEKELVRDTLVELQSLLEWVESLLEFTPVAGSVAPVVAPKAVALINTVQQTTIDKPSAFEQTVLDKLERIEKDLALTKDKMVQYDRSLKLLTANSSSVTIATDQNVLPPIAKNPAAVAGSPLPVLTNKNLKPGAVNLVTLEVNAFDVKKDNSATLAARVQNLKKANATKRAEEEAIRQKNTQIENIAANMFNPNQPSSTVSIGTDQAALNEMMKDSIEYYKFSPVDQDLVPSLASSWLKYTSKTESYNPGTAAIWLFSYLNSIYPDALRLVAGGTASGLINEVQIEVNADDKGRLLCAITEGDVTFDEFDFTVGHVDDDDKVPTLYHYGIVGICLWSIGKRPTNDNASAFNQKRYTILENGVVQVFRQWLRPVSINSQQAVTASILEFWYNAGMAHVLLINNMLINNYAKYLVRIPELKEELASWLSDCISFMEVPAADRKLYNVIHGGENCFPSRNYPGLVALARSVIVTTTPKLQQYATRIQSSPLPILDSIILQETGTGIIPSTNSGQTAPVDPNA
ncbi:hypothetical protein [Parasitella parasitica]|uniref:Uncharacterized protein n=1 Tax=Parasitella parasitica TaxID=35722 RepID=A0A0B7MXV0_9FUNG|nr:hypothetical protein [Parasitella parasitica]